VGFLERLREDFMLRRKLAFIAALALGGLIRSTPVLADTITVHDLSENTATGVFTYTIQLDAAADVATNDGFVIYDFPGLTSWSISGVSLNSSQFTLNSTPVSNTLNQPASVDAFGNVAAISDHLAFDNPSVPNLSFDYQGPPVLFLGATTAILTLTSSITGGSADSVYASIDHSGSSAGTPFSFASNAVLVPAPGTGSTTPLPAASVGGAVLFGLVGLGQLRKRTVA
jgi:hypothetical protein